MTTQKELLASFGAHGGRHGDLLIVPVETIPTGLNIQKDNILAHGEQGNEHRLVNGQVTMYAGSDDKKYFEVKGECELIHEQHHVENIPEGKYELINEREFEPFTEEINKVRD